MAENTTTHGIHVGNDAKYAFRAFALQGNAHVSLDLAPNTGLYFSELDQIDDLILALQEARIALAAKIEELAEQERRHDDAMAQSAWERARR